MAIYLCIHGKWFPWNCVCKEFGIIYFEFWNIRPKLGFKKVSLCISYLFFRSSHWGCSVKKGILKNLANFTGIHLCWNLFLIKLHASPVKFVTFLRTSILKNICEQLLLPFCKTASSRNLGFQEIYWKNYFY